MSYTQDFNVGASSTMNTPFAQGGYTNVTMPHFNLFVNSSAMAGGYTSLLMGVDQDATTQAVVRKLHFDEYM
jgi:hypothetical protein